jgi:SAM-dependent methyltransferase
MTTPAADIGAIFDALTSYQRSAAMKAAIELDVFTAIAEGAATLPALAARVGASARGLRALVSRLVVDGFLTVEGEAYGLAPAAAMFLDRRSPAYAGSAAAFVTSPHVVAGFDRLTEAVRRGGTALGDEHSLAPEHPMWVEFARAMAPFARFTARLLANLLQAGTAGAWKILDVAAGHGMFGITLLEENPRAEVAALDWENVLAVAREHAAAAGVAGRFRTIAGSAFEVAWGGPYDLVLLPNFLHHFDEAGCREILRRAHAALAPEGRVVIVEFVPNPDRVSPPEAAAFALTMLAGTPGGDAYTFAEYAAMLDATGFADAALHDLAPSPNRAIVARRAAAA